MSKMADLQLQLSEVPTSILVGELIARFEEMGPLDFAGQNVPVDSWERLGEIVTGVLFNLEED